MRAKLRIADCRLVDWKVHFRRRRLSSWTIPRLLAWLEIANLKFEISNLKLLWRCLREATGDAAYERYLRWAQRRAGGSGACSRRPPRLLSREEFYVDTLRRRYSGVSRCC